jgi:hypothetical protein
VWQEILAVAEFARIQSVTAHLNSGEFSDSGDRQDFLTYPAGFRMFATLAMPASGS